MTRLLALALVVFIMYVTSLLSDYMHDKYEEKSEKNNID